MRRVTLLALLAVVVIVGAYGGKITAQDVTRHYLILAKGQGAALAIMMRRLERS